MRSLSLRLRLTLAFAGVMAVLLAIGALVIWIGVERSLDTSIRKSLRTRAADVAALVTQGDTGLKRSGQSPLTESGESLAQVLSPAGALIDATPHLRGGPLLSRSELARADTTTFTVDRASLPGVDGRARLLVTRVNSDQGPRVVVVGTSLEDRDAALWNLTLLLCIGGPVALLLASGAGLWVAASALRPVEAMRARAARISGGEAGERLPAPAAGDEIGRLGETLNSMLERIEGARARERAFVADASHELRTPLAILKTELELAQRGTRSMAELRAAIASAREETERLSRLAADLLVIARSDQGRLPVHASPLDARAVLEDVRRRHADRAQQAGRSLTVDDPGPMVFRADRLRLDQALGNLVDNALQHGRGAITIAAAPDGDGVRLSVADEGPGMPSDFAPRAFERFSRADPGRGDGGGGLGLAIVEAIARAHGGEAGFSAGDGAGFTAWLSIPASAADPAADAARPPSGALSSTARLAGTRDGRRTGA